MLTVLDAIAVLIALALITFGGRCCKLLVMTTLPLPAVVCPETGAIVMAFACCIDFVVVAELLLLLLLMVINWPVVVALLLAVTV